MIIPLDRLCPGCFNPPGQDATTECPICKYRPNAARSEALLPVGTRVGTPPEDYVIGKSLGQGKFGITYRGFDSKLHTRVAIKECYPSDYVRRSVEGDRKTVELKGEGDQERKENGENFNYVLNAFLREARTLAKVEHPHVVRVLRHIEMHNTAYMVMNFYEGVDLKKYLHEQPGKKLPWRQAVELLLPILDGLQAVHLRDIIHLDIKPGNLYLISDKNHLMLLDFGAARQVTGSQSFSKVVGTEGYAPYEQLSGSKVGSFTDVYAAAATLYVMLTAQKLPRSINRMDYIRSRKPDPLKPARHLVSGLPLALDKVLSRALAVEPKRRTQSVGKFKQELKAVLEKEENEGKKAPRYKDYNRVIVICMVIGTLAAVEPTLSRIVETARDWWNKSWAATRYTYLTVRATPKTAQVRIVSIDREYRDKMELAPGNFEIEVTASGYQTYRAWHTLAAGEQDLSITLQPMPLPHPGSPPVAPIPPAVETPPVVEPAPPAAASSDSGDAAGQKRLDLQLTVAKKLLEERKIPEALLALENAKAWDREGRVEAFRRERTGILHAAAMRLLEKGRRDRAKLVVDDLGKWDPQSPEYQTIRERLTGQ